MSLVFYNTLTRQKEEFVPQDPNHVGLYVCGPTVYDYAHIGNARPFVIFDVLAHLLRHLYPKVTYVRNITDVDDKINAAARQNNESIATLTERTTKMFHEDMATLGVKAPDVEPRATHHIAEMITMIQGLIDKGHAYAAEGHVLFRVHSFAEYGKLARRNQDEILAGARVEVAPYKQDPGDFVLWKPSDEGTPGWDSPWSYGRPGWHIECSAMSWRYLGETFDIHGGGIDLTFPHHENEVAQSRCFHGKPVFARYWLHNGHLTVNGEKMSKSLGNFLTIHDLLKDHAGETLRMGLLATHYRQPLDWSTESTTQQAKQTLDRFYLVLRQAGIQASEPGTLDPRILEALSDDLNTPLAIAHLHDLATHYNKTNDRECALKLKGSGTFLGVLQVEPAVWFQGATTGLSVEDIENQIELRRKARAEKQFAESDRIRQELLSQGVIIEDSPQGTTWRRQ